MALPRMITAGAPRSRRVPRSPRHPFFVKQRPWSITPFFIAPVLPGETMKLLLMQARAVSKPIVNPLMGHHLEYHFFYVKHRDLNERATLTQMMLDVNAGTGVAPQAATSAPLYTAAGTVPWVRMCLQRVTEEYFRLPGEAWNVEVDADGLPVARVSNAASWLDSFQWESQMEVGPNVNVDLDASGVTTAREVELALQQYEMLREMGMVENTYEEYLRSYGIKQQPVELNRPELVRSVKEWAYPVNHVEPTTGVPSSAMSWKVAERADKDRFFREPGFLFGVSIWRPKVYWTDQKGTATGLLDNMLAWLPKTLAGDNSVSLKKFVAQNSLIPNVDPTTAPATNVDNYWIDLRDLFLYGEQFVSGTVPVMPLPDANGRTQFPPQASIANLFTGANQYLEQDGMVSVTIMGEQSDLTMETARPTRAV
jgi:hypothetical protein